MNVAEQAVSRTAGLRTGYAFADFTYDAGMGCFCGERRVGLSPLECRLLGCLVGATGHVVRKDALAAHAWLGTAASDESIARTVHMVRRKLREYSDDRVVETVYAQGYRIAVPVRRTAAEASPAPPEAASALTVAIVCLREVRETLQRCSSADLRSAALQVERVERLLARVI